MDKIKPKYYKCVELNAEENFTYDKIYRIINPDNLNDYGNFIDNKGKRNGFAPNNEKSFTPVTELEWNLQEGIITKIVSEDYSYLIPILKQLDIR